MFKKLKTLLSQAHKLSFGDKNHEIHRFYYPKEINSFFAKNQYSLSTGIHHKLILLFKHL